MAAITFHSVSKQYGEVVALNELSYQFAEGEITAVVGRSGSGKSTLLQLINAIERPDAGHVEIFARPIQYDQLTVHRRQFGYAVQGTGLFPHKTVLDNICLPAVIAGWETARAQARAAELMAFVELQPEFSFRYPHELSGGQNQRVGLCRAMLCNPRIFLLDEPFGALDPITRTEIHRQWLKVQKTDPRTIVLVTHDMREAVKLADNVLILEEGNLIQAGKTPGVIENPASDFVADLIHSQLDL